MRKDRKGCCIAQENVHRSVIVGGRVCEENTIPMYFPARFEL